MSAQSNILSAIECASSIGSRVDALDSALNSINSQLSSINSKVDGLYGRFDAINNLIDSLENVILGSINGIASIINGVNQQLTAFIDLLRDLLLGKNFGGNTDKLEGLIDDLFIHFDDALNYNGELIKAAINDCCSRLSNLINELLRNTNNDAILDAINRLDGRIIESIGGSESRIINDLIRELNQNENKLDAIINKLNDGDSVTRILAAISAALGLFNNILAPLDNNKCDLSNLESLIANIRCDMGTDAIIYSIDAIKNQISLVNNQLAIKLDANTNAINDFTDNINNILYEDNLQMVNYLTTNNIFNNNSVTNAVTNAVNNSVTNAINNSVTNAINNSVTNAVNNSVTNAVNTISSQIVNSTSSIINSNNHYVLIKVPIFVDCEDGQPKFDEEEILVKEGTEELEYLIFDKLAKIEAIKCTKVEPVAIIPEWWQLRLEGNVPQFVIAFGEVDQLTGKCLHAKYPMTIPHFKNVKPLSCPVPRYRKGNYELLGIMKDNSKLIINAFSEYECERVYDSIFPFLDPAFSSSMKYKIGKRVGYQFKEIWVCPRFGKYFSQGTKDTNPDWTVYF